MSQNGSMVQLLSEESAKDYVQNVLHMDKVRRVPSPSTDYIYFKGRNEDGSWMEVRVERKPDKNKMHNVAERRWEDLREDDFEWIDALPEWNGEPSDDINQYLPEK